MYSVAQSMHVKQRQSVHQERAVHHSLDLVRRLGRVEVDEAEAAVVAAGLGPVAWDTERKTSDAACGSNTDDHDVGLFQSRGHDQSSPFENIP